jgi:DNA-directed RNA polymerase subunit RPC12/RpoP
MDNMKYEWLPYKNGIHENIGSIWLMENGHKKGKAIASFVNRPNGKRISKLLNQISTEPHGEPVTIKIHKTRDTGRINYKGKPIYDYCLRCKKPIRVNNGRPYKVCKECGDKILSEVE